MKTDRREFLDEVVAPWKKALGLLGVAVVLSRCSSSSPTPSAPTAPPSTAAPQPKAQTVPATGKYAVEVVTNEDIANVAEALQLAGVTVVIEDKTTWTTTAGSKFAGGLIQQVSDVKGFWRVDIDKGYPCTDVRHQPVRKNQRISLFFDDGVAVTGACS